MDVTRNSESSSCAMWSFFESFAPMDVGPREGARNEGVSTEVVAALIVVSGAAGVSVEAGVGSAWLDMSLWEEYETRQVIDRQLEPGTSNSLYFSYVCCLW